MKQYSIFHPLYMSFFSKDLYQDVRNNWKGAGFLYLLLITVLLSIPFTIMIHIGLSDFLRTATPQFVEQVPEIHIKNGEVSTPENKIYTITIPFSEEDNDTVNIMIDTTGTINSLEEASGAQVLLTKTKLYMEQENRNEVRIYDLSEVDDFTISQPVIRHWVDIIAAWAAVVLYPFILLAFYIWYIIQLLLYSVIGIIITNILKITLDYQDITRLTVIAMTPVLIIGTIVMVMDIKIPFWGFLCIAVTTAYMAFGMKVSSDNVSQSTEQISPPTPPVE